MNANYERGKCGRAAFSGGKLLFQCHILCILFWETFGNKREAAATVLNLFEKKKNVSKSAEKNNKSQKTKNIIYKWLFMLISWTQLLRGAPFLLLIIYYPARFVLWTLNKNLLAGRGDKIKANKLCGMWPSQDGLHFWLISISLLSTMHQSKFSTFCPWNESWLLVRKFIP